MNLKEAIVKFEKTMGLVNEDKRRTDKLIEDYKKGNYNEHDLLADSVQRLKMQSEIIDRLVNMDRYVSEMTLEEACEYYKSKFDIEHLADPYSFTENWNIFNYLKDLIKVQNVKQETYDFYNRVREIFRD